MHYQLQELIMGKIKSVESLVNRIIEKVEAGDYDTGMLVHMVESIVVNRDKRIKLLEDRNRPRKFIMTEKKVSGALRDCIKTHGDITKQNISSAAKRIYRGCIELDTIPEPVVRADNPTIDIIRDKNTKHKLTVARNGNIRIKIAIGSPIAEANFIIDKFTQVAVDALELNKSTLRGSVKLGDTNNCIILYTDSKIEHHSFKY